MDKSKTILMSRIAFNSTRELAERFAGPFAPRHRILPWEARSILDALAAGDLGLLADGETVMMSRSEFDAMLRAIPEEARVDALLADALPRVFQSWKTPMQILGALKL